MLLPLAMKALQLLLNLNFSLLSLSFCVSKNIFEVTDLLFDGFVCFVCFVGRPLTLRQLPFLRLFDYCIFKYMMVGIELCAKIGVNRFNIFDRLIEKLFAARYRVVGSVIASVAWKMERWSIWLSSVLFSLFVQLKEWSFLFHIKLWE